MSRACPGLLFQKRTMYPAQTNADHPQFAPVNSATLVTTLPGCWMLKPGCAVRLRASQAGEVCVARGRIWLTFDGAATDISVCAGDYFLAGGESLRSRRASRW